MAYICVPFWLVVMVILIHVFSDEFWLMLSKVGINKQKNDSCVQELGIEHTICDAW